jgi:arabinan endo-1,5-alpha-L-arabinosidase
VHWKLLGDAMPTLPAWTSGDIWAPHIAKVGDRFNVYYAARVAGHVSMAVGVQSATSPTGTWVDRGSPLVRRQFGEQAYSVLDPFMLETPKGEKILYWGSGYTNIRAQRLSDDGMSVVGDPVDVLSPNRPRREGDYESMIEAAWVVMHDGLYYLMCSGDETSAANPHYAVVVARSTSPFGPFERNPNNPILARNAVFDGPGHNATVKDDAGEDWILYHAIPAGGGGEHGVTPRKPMLDHITWENGWPVINGGTGPSSGPRPAPAEYPAGTPPRASVPVPG